MPYIHSTENLVFERLQQQEREQRQRQSRPRVHSGTHRLMRNPGAFFIAMGAKLRQVAQRDKSAI